MFSRNFMVISILLLLLAVSALGVVFNGYQHRQLFIGLQSLQQQESELKVQFGRLKLEESAWSSPALIEELAMSQLSMRVPKNSQLNISTRSGAKISRRVNTYNGGVDSALLATNNPTNENLSR